MKLTCSIRAVMTLWFLAAAAIPVSGQTAVTNQSFTYTLVEGSDLVDDCPVCARPTILVAMRGTFQLRLLEEGALFRRFALEDISFLAGSPVGRQYRVTGSGTYRLGGEVALVQEMLLQLQIDDGISNKLCLFTNVPGATDRPWPSIQITLDQTNGTLLQTYELMVSAAPFREIWFSTASGFRAGIWQPPTNHVSPGDLISSAGRVVKRNSELSAQLGIMPSVPDLGLDAVDILAGGEIAFSIEEDIFSETLGPLHQGDVLSDRGGVLHHYADLIGVFVPEPPVADQGLDALQVMSSTEIYFSVENDFFSEKLGRKIRRGDLLSSLGRVVKTNEELIARFNPADPKQDYGLDALYVWPGGEIWFSTETGFYGPHFEFYAPGDLLSDQGYVVYRNHDLMFAFQPLETLADFGLDSLFVVADSIAPAPAPQIVDIRQDRTRGSVQVRWDGNGRVFQVEGATDVAGPYLPRSPMMPDRSFEDLGVLLSHPRFFYRVRQW